MSTPRVLAVLDRICSHPELITEVVKEGDEYYFRFKGHTMSIMYRSDHNQVGRHSLYIYPDYTGDLNILAADLSRMAPDDLNIKMASFHGPDYDETAFERLYRTLENRFLNVDAIFEDILEDLC